MNRRFFKLLGLCEAEPDYWVNARHFANVGEYGLAMEGLFVFLLERDDLWAQHHALIKSLKRDFAGAIDFDDLEFRLMDGGRYSEVRAILEWREEVVAELSEREG